MTLEEAVTHDGNMAVEVTNEETAARLGLSERYGETYLGEVRGTLRHRSSDESHREGYGRISWQVKGFNPITYEHGIYTRREWLPLEDLEFLDA